MGPHHKKSDLQKKKDHFLKLYKSWNKVYCPALKADVHFTNYAWLHLVKDKYRTGKETLRRLEVLPLAKKLIEKSGTIQHKRFHKGRVHYEFQADMDGRIIRVVIFDNWGKFTFKTWFIV